MFNSSAAIDDIILDFIKFSECPIAKYRTEDTNITFLCSNDGSEDISLLALDALPLPNNMCVTCCIIL